MSAEENKEIARKMFQAHHDGDMEGFLAPLAEDVKWYYMTDHPTIGGLRNKHQWREALIWGATRTEGGIRMDVRTIYGEDDMVAVEAVALGKQKGSGAEYANMVMFSLVFRDGKIIEGRQYNDTWHVDQIIHHDAS